jgi:hypothetical protein
MSPLDDELRRTLAARAASVTAPPDPLTGIESRARGLRRRRALGVVASAALAVTAVALVVPAVVDRGPGAPDRQASPSASAPASAHPAVLDPARPWALRGDETLLADGTLDAVRREWVARHPRSALTPLFAQRWEPSGRIEVAFVATGDGVLRVGWVILRSGGPDFVQDEVSKAPDAAYQFALPGDEGVTRLYVVAAPDSRISYAADGVTYRDITLGFVTHKDGLSSRTTTILGGVGVTAVETAGARVRVTAADGIAVYEADARGAGSSPANLLDWPARGSVSLSPSVDDLKAAFAGDSGYAASAVLYRPLFTADTDSGVKYTVGQAWFSGDSRADTVSYSIGGRKGPVLTRYGFTPDSPAALVALITDRPGTSVDLLVVVPTPTTGQVSYAAGATGSFQPVTGQDHLDGVVLIDRASGTIDDRLEILDGNGNLDQPLYRGPVATLLQGEPAH